MDLNANFLDFLTKCGVQIILTETSPKEQLLRIECNVGTYPHTGAQKIFKKTDGAGKVDFIANYFKTILAHRWHPEGDVIPE